MLQNWTVSSDVFFIYLLIPCTLQVQRLLPPKSVLLHSTGLPTGHTFLNTSAPTPILRACELVYWRHITRPSINVRLIQHYHTFPIQTQTKHNGLFLQLFVRQATWLYRRSFGDITQVPDIQCRNGRHWTSPFLQAQTIYCTSQHGQAAK